MAELAEQAHPGASDRAARALPRLREVVGPEGAELGAEARAFGLGVAPDLVARPATAAQAAEVLALARAERWKVTAAGAGSWTAVPPDPRPTLVLSAARLDQVHAYEPRDPTASVGAGVGLAALAALTAQHRQWLPLDAAGAAGATVGAAVALGVGGPLAFGYGAPREHVLGLELVTGDGRVLALGGRVLKNVAGYDLTRLAVGSRGALGLVTRVHLRLRPLPEVDLTLAVAADLDTCLSLCPRACGRPEAAAVELLSPALWSRLGGGPGAWAVLTRLHGEKEAVDHARAEALAAARAGGLQVVELEPAAWAALAEAEAARPLTVRLADRPSALVQTVALAQQLCRAWPDAALAAHCGDGVVRLFPRAEDLAAPGWAEAVGAARRALAARGGTLLLGPAHAPGHQGLSAYGELGPTRRLMRGLKEQFDPEAVLSDGGFDF